MAQRFQTCTESSISSTRPVTSLSCNSVSSATWTRFSSTDMTSEPIKIGYCLSLTGALGANGQTARLTHQIWQEDVNARGGLLGREVSLVCIDDQSNAAS